MVSNETIAVNRDALYYPYVDIQDVNWLKATLLCFPRIWLMLPAVRSMSPEIYSFSQTETPRGSLLTWMEKEHWEENEVQAAQDKLLTKMQENEQLLVERFSLQATLEQRSRGEAVDYLLHVTKPGEQLIGYLVEQRLAWRYPSGPMSERGLHSDDWVGMHPRLGEAILSMVAVTVAKKKDSEIVTNDEAVHQTVVSNDTEYVFESLIQYRDRIGPDRQGTEAQVAQLVMTTNFDVSQFSARDIAALIGDESDLRRWKNRIRGVVASRPMPSDPVAREKVLKDATKQILDEWCQYRRSLGNVVAGAFLDTCITVGPSMKLLGQGEGLAVGILLLAAARAYRAVKQGMKNDYQYLSRIKDRQHSLAFGMHEVPS